MESRFGYDFGRVRVHSDPAAAESAQGLNALAYTIGRDVVFGSGQYAPGTQRGRELLAHELAHVLQQPSQEAAAPIAIGEPGDSFEREAGGMTEAVMDQAGSLRQRGTQRMRSQPGVIRRQEVKPPTEGEVKEEARLRRLASRPSEALTQWKKLNEKERGFVNLVMLGRYGFEFAQDFQQYASGEKKPNISTEISNAPENQPEELVKRGYKHAFDNVWVHPSGHEIWVLSPGKTGDEDGPKQGECIETCSETSSEDECNKCCEEKVPDSDPRCLMQCKGKCQYKLD